MFDKLNIRDVFKIPNLLSILRILLLIPFGILLPIDTPVSKAFNIAVISIMVLTDFLDGYTARKLNQTTELGKILDPLADKLCFIMGGLFFTIFKGLPLWILLYLFIRDGIVFVAGAFLSAKKETVVQSNIWGKLSTAILSVSFLFMLIFGIGFILTKILLLIGLIIFTYAALNYAFTFLIPNDNANRKRRLILIMSIVFIILIIALIMLVLLRVIPAPPPF